MGAQVRTVHRTLSIWFLALATCGEPRDPPAVESAPADASSDPTDPFTYRASLVATTLAGETVVPLVELLSPGEVRIVVAVQRGDATDPVVELWTFDQRDAKGTLLRAGSPTPLLRSRPGEPSPPELADLRRRLAAPGVVVHRPLGITAASPGEAVAAIARAARTVRDRTVPASDRVAALATVFAGLDDAIVLDADGLAAALDALANDRWTASTTNTPSARRALVTTTSGATLTLLLADERWTLTAVQ